MQLTCKACGRPFDAKTRRRKYCGDTCRQRAQRARGKPVGQVVPLRPPTEDGGVESATRAELQEVDRVGTALGQAALALARRLDVGQADTGSAMASLVREWRATLTAATEGATATEDPIDELRAQWEKKLRRA